MTEPAAKRIPTVAVVIPTLVLAWCLYLIFLGPSRDGGGLGAPPLDSGGGRPADFNWRLADLDGKPVDFKSFRGRPIFLNIWATWCPPCVAELPSIARLAADPRVKDVTFLCVSDESAEEVRAFLARRKLDLPVYLAQAPAPPVFQTQGIPATFIIDSDGKIVAAEVGSAQWDAPEVVNRLAGLTSKAD